ncbi:unnamed protein product, partial [Rotaria sordida]
MLFKNGILLYFITILNQYNCIIVETPLGKVSGNQIDVLSKHVNEFLGIPFGLPPINEFRFSKPRPTQPWNGIWNATYPRIACYRTKSKAPPEVQESEDCLYLNIWTPVNKENQTLKPVMFWIYGGYFTQGYIDRDGYNGSVLAALGDIVFVSANYRLDAFGFLYGNNETAPGNVGWYDQNLALQWIQKNIQSFGGDPNSVTIFGESAGSTSVAAHIVSPLSNKLFHRAILQSGSIYKYQYLHRKNATKENNLELAIKMSKAFNCSQNHDQWLNCLRNIHPKSIVNYTL